MPPNGARCRSNYLTAAGRSAPLGDVSSNNLGPALFIVPLATLALGCGGSRAAIDNDPGQAASQIAGEGASSSPAQCPALLASAKGAVAVLDAGSCSTRAATSCAGAPGLSEQDVVSDWLRGATAACAGLADAGVVVAFQDGCATEVRFVQAVAPEAAACLTTKVGALRWDCHDLVCAHAGPSPLP